MLEIINKLFPNAQYREIFLKNDPKAEQAGMSHKAPMNSRILSFDEIKNTQNRVGWIVPDGYTVIDIDDKVNSKKIQKLLMGEDIETLVFETEHGAHFVFRSIPGVFQTQGTFCRLGIKIDTRSNASGYIILPHNDPDRRVVSTANTIPDLPQYLLPENIDFPDISKVDKGERNGELFKLMTKLKLVKSITIDQIKQCVYLANEYILNEPLSRAELDKTILCEKNLARGANVSKVSPNTIACELLEDLHLVTTKLGMYMFNGKYYEPCDDFQLARVIHTKYADFGKDKRNEVIEFVKLKTYTKAENLNSDWRKITVRNGVLNLMTGELTDFTSDYIATKYVDIEFIPNVPVSVRVENFLNGLSGYNPDKPELEQQMSLDKKTKLLEFIGYCLVSRNKFQKIFFLLGPGHTGKSTFLELVRKLFGADNCAALSMSDLESTFMPAQLKDKLVNIGDDISMNTLLDGATVKILCGTLPIEVQQKYEKPYSLVNEAKFIFSCNKMPLFKDKTDGLLRRLEIIEITNKIAYDKADSDFIEKFTHEDMQYLFWQAFLAINNALTRDSLTSSICCSEALEKYRTQSSTVLSFMKSDNMTSWGQTAAALGKANDFIGKSYAAKYREYLVWCLDNGKMKQSLENFIDNVCAEFNLCIQKGIFAKNE